MKRRAIRQDRRRYAILGVLAETTDATVRTIATALRLNVIDVHHELYMLELSGRVISERVMPLTETAPSRTYRLPDHRSTR